MNLHTIHSSFPVLELQEQKYLKQLFLTPDQASTSLSIPSPTAFLNTIIDRKGSEALEKPYQINDQEGDKYISIGRSSDHNLVSSSSLSSSSSSCSFQAMVNVGSDINLHNLSASKRQDDEASCEGSGDGSLKSMPSNMNINKTMMNPEINQKPMKFTVKFRSEIGHSSIDNKKNNNNNNNNIRVCSDCSTTTTPLWRSGPRGPKSLCNACGIRQRKARKAAAAAAATDSGASTEPTSSLSTKNNNKVHNSREKKWRTSHAAQSKKMWRPFPEDHLHHPSNHHHHHHHHQPSQKKLCFKNLALRYLSKNSAIQRVFSEDVEEAAMLLMELSCGLFHT